MTDTTFEFIYDAILKDAAEVFPAIDGNSAYLRKSWNYKDALLQHKVAIREHYIYLRDIIKKEFMENSSEPLDRHKCGACFMVAFLEKFYIGENGLNKEHVAIYIGTLILKLFIFFENRNSKDSAAVNFIKKSNGLKFPERICDKRAYEDNWALELYFARKKNRLFAPSLANELFCIERYNRERVEIESLISENMILKQQLRDLSK